MNKLLLGVFALVLFVLGIGVAGLIRLEASSRHYGSFSVLVHDTETGETIGFGTLLDGAGKIFSANAWTSRTGERIEEREERLSTDKVLLHFVISKNGISKATDKTVLIGELQHPNWVAIDEHLETAAEFGHTTISM